MGVAECVFDEDAGLGMARVASVEHALEARRVEGEHKLPQESVLAWAVEADGDDLVEFVDGALEIAKRPLEVALYRD